MFLVSNCIRGQHQQFEARDENKKGKAILMALPQKSWKKETK